MPTPQRITTSLLTLAVLFVAGSLSAQSPKRTPTPAEARVGMLMNFARFTAWPRESFPDTPETRAPIVIGFLADDEAFQTAVDAIKDNPTHTIQGRTVEFRRIDPPTEKPETMTECAHQAAQVHVLYIGPINRPARLTILQTLERKPILTVSNEDRFLEDGGMIALFTERGRYRFEIRKKSLNDAGLEISSKVLELARRVIRD